MKHEVTIKLAIESPADADRVARQIESLFGCGTVRESIADGLHLDEDPRLIGVETAGDPAPDAEKRAFPVIIAVDVTSYCTLQVEAASDAEASEIVGKSIEKDGWESPYWQRAADWDTDWQNAENLRVI